MEVEIDYNWFVEEVEKARKKGTDKVHLGSFLQRIEEQKAGLVAVELIAKVRKNET